MCTGWTEGRHWAAAGMRPSDDGLHRLALGADDHGPDAASATRSNGRRSCRSSSQEWQVVGVSELLQEGIDTPESRLEPTRLPWKKAFWVFRIEMYPSLSTTISFRLKP